MGKGGFVPPSIILSFLHWGIVGGWVVVESQHHRMASPMAHSSLLGEATQGHRTLPVARTLIRPLIFDPASIEQSVES